MDLRLTLGDHFDDDYDIPIAIAFYTPIWLSTDRDVVNNATGNCNTLAWRILFPVTNSSSDSSPLAWSQLELTHLFNCCHLSPPSSLKVLTLPADSVDSAQSSIPLPPFVLTTNRICSIITQSLGSRGSTGSKAINHLFLWWQMIWCLQEVGEELERGWYMPNELKQCISSWRLEVGQCTLL